MPTGDDAATICRPLEALVLSKLPFPVLGKPHRCHPDCHLRWAESGVNCGAAADAADAAVTAAQLKRALTHERCRGCTCGGPWRLGWLKGTQRLLKAL